MENIVFDQFLNLLTFERLTDNSFSYEYKDKDIIIGFYKDENDKNHIDEFKMFSNGVWNDVTPNDYQRNQMHKKLNETPFFEDEDEEVYPMSDFDNYGVEPKNFY